MAYARQPMEQNEQEYSRVFRHDVQQDDDLHEASYSREDGYPYEDEDMTYDDYADYLTDEERRRDKWRMLSGLGDFLGVLVGAVVILVLVALLVSLINWVQADISQSFTLWQTKM